MPRALVVGASRGLGREIARQLLECRKYQVSITVRKANDGPQHDKRLQVLQLDITDEASVTAAAAQVHSLDLLVINAAIGNKETITSTTSERLSEYLDTNVIGPHRVVRAFLGALKRGSAKQIILIASQSGSLTKQVGSQHGLGGPYAVSKAALNMLAVQLHNELHGEGFTVVPLYPGWVATDMGRINGDGGMPVAQSVQGMLEVISELDQSKSGHCLTFEGTELPW